MAEVKISASEKIQNCLVKTFKICTVYLTFLSCNIKENGTDGHYQYSNKLKNVLQVLLREPSGKKIPENVGIYAKIYSSRY